MSRSVKKGPFVEKSLYKKIVEMNKAGIVKLGHELNVPFELTWSCYNGSECACGKCGTCIDRINAN